MARQGGTHDAYTGRSGQMAVMAELLCRRCNAAVPEVDVGTDVFAFHDEREGVARIQVKTAQAKRYKKGQGYTAQFSIPAKQLERPDQPPLYYALAIRLEEKYVDFLVIDRARLNDYWSGSQRLGTMGQRANVVLKIQFRDRVVCGEVNLSDYRNAWNLLPPLQPLISLLEEDA